LVIRLPPISRSHPERKRGGAFARFRAWVCAILPPVLCCLLLLVGLPAPAQAADIAILKSSDISAYNQAVAGFKTALPVGTNFVEYDMQGDVAKGRKQAQKIRGSDTALVLAVGLKAALVAKLEIIDIPVIFCMVLDPAKHDLKAPNMTGILLEVPIERQLATLGTVLPGAKRVGVLYDPEKTGPFLEEARRRAKGFGLELVSQAVASEKDVPSALRGLISRVDTFWLIPDSTVLTEDSLRFLLNTALEASIPVLGFSPDLVKSGALVGLSVNYEDIGRQGGALAKSILSGKSRSQALTPPERLRMSLNLKTARYLGITVPPDIVSRADDVY
jgi:putative ABC transport system substrate-binding protein